MITPYFSTQLGKLYHGDCLKILPTIESESVDLVLTDIPYNTGMCAKNDLKRKKDWLGKFFDDNMPDDEYEALIRAALSECYRVMKPNTGIYIFIDQRNDDKVRTWVKETGFNYKQTLVWDKVVHGLNYQNYAYRQERIVYADKGEPVKTVIEVHRERGYDDIIYAVKGAHNPNRIHYTTDIIRCPRVNPNDSPDHETVKPLELIRNLIEDNVERERESHPVVLDPFFGSGQCGVAAEQLGVRWIGCELVERYCEMSKTEITKISTIPKLESFFGGN